MIGRLKRKFVLINMGLVALVLLIVFGAVMYSSYRAMVTRADQALYQTMEIRENAPQKVPEIGKNNGGRRREPDQRTPALCVELDTEGAILSVQQSNVTIGSEALSDIVKLARGSGESSGYLSAYELRYRIRYTSAGCRIAFVDVGSDLDSLSRQALVLLVVGLCGLGAFLVISLFLAGWALRPVERAWEQQRRFVADASHELKTPLTVILANNDILLSHPASTIQTERRWIENTQAEGLRMKGLIDDMLYLAKADAAAPLPMQTFGLSEAVWAAILPFESVAFEKGVAINAKIADRIAIYGNEPAVRQLTGILMDNAVKYAGENGSVDVELTEKSEAVLLSVHNTGAPIPAEDLPHLFERFYRAESSRARAGGSGGYGLGLSIAKSIAGQHRAEISVASGAENGTTFTVEWRKRSYGKKELFA